MTSAPQEMPDPVANAIDCMLDHIHVMDSQMENMCQSLKQLGMELPDLELPDLGACEMSIDGDKEKAKSSVDLAD